MKGITLIEVIIYVCLLSILMLGVLPSVYVLIDSQHTDKQVDIDAGILLKKYSIYE